METKGMPRFSPATPRSRRLGRELKRLRGQMTLDEAGKRANCSPSRVARVESGEIKVRPGDVMELLVAYSVPIEDEHSQALLAMARDLREPGWWQRLNTLPSKYATYIAYEAEAQDIRNFEPMLVPGLLQTEAYARAVISVGRETESEAIEQRVHARMTRQDNLTRKPPLRLWAILSEAVLCCEVGGPDVMQEQMRHLTAKAALPNVTVQVLPFAAGAHLADNGSFSILSAPNDPDLGYIDTLAGSLFLENSEEIRRLSAVFDHLKTLSLSPAESVKLIRERGK